MNIEEKNGFAYVAIAYEIKEAFKKAFPHAIWLDSEKRWKINLEDVFNCEKFFVNLQIKQINLEKKQTEDKIELRTSRNEELSKILELLESKKQELASAKSKAEAERVNIDAKKKEIEEKLNCIIDLQALKKSAQVMRENHIPSETSAKAKFREAQSDFLKAQENLKECGLACSAIDYCCDANINRPDRDSVKNMSEKAWYKIREVEKE